VLTTDKYSCLWSRKSSEAIDDLAETSAQGSVLLYSKSRTG